MQRRPSTWCSRPTRSRAAYSSVSRTIRGRSRCSPSTRAPRYSGGHRERSDDAGFYAVGVRRLCFGHRHIGGRDRGEGHGKGRLDQYLWRTDHQRRGHIQGRAIRDGHGSGHHVRGDCQRSVKSHPHACHGERSSVRLADQTTNSIDVALQPTGSLQITIGDAGTQTPTATPSPTVGPSPTPTATLPALTATAVAVAEATQQSSMLTGTGGLTNGSTTTGSDSSTVDTPVHPTSRTASARRATRAGQPAPQRYHGQRPAIWRSFRVSRPRRQRPLRPGR